MAQPYGQFVNRLVRQKASGRMAVLTQVPGDNVSDVATGEIQTPISFQMFALHQVYEAARTHLRRRRARRRPSSQQRLPASIYVADQLATTLALVKNPAPRLKHDHDHQ